MRIKFWGVRGSIPSSLTTDGWVRHFETLMTEFLNAGYKSAAQVSEFIQKKTVPAVGGFGTATTCVQVSDGNQSIIIDGGSGIKNLSDELAIAYANKSAGFSTDNEFHILISHFHFDHILGIPFFTPHFLKGKKINYYSVQSETESVIRQLFKKPTFPVTYESLQAEIKFHTICPYEKQIINGFEVTAFKLDHPDPCYGFRVEKNKKVYAHAIDHEAVRTSTEQLGLDGQLFKGADLLYFDAQYEEKEMASKLGWGHGTCDRGFQVARTFGIKRILFAHHDPSVQATEIFQQKKNAEMVLASKFNDLKKDAQFQWDYAYEGQIIEL